MPGVATACAQRRAPEASSRASSLTADPRALTASGQQVKDSSGNGANWYLGTPLAVSICHATVRGIRCDRFGSAWGNKLRSTALVLCSIIVITSMISGCLHRNHSPHESVSNRSTNQLEVDLKHLSHESVDALLIEYSLPAPVVLQEATPAAADNGANDLMISTITTNSESDATLTFSKDSPRFIFRFTPKWYATVRRVVVYEVIKWFSELYSKYNGSFTSSQSQDCYAITVDGLDVQLWVPQGAILESQVSMEKGELRIIR